MVGALVLVCEQAAGDVGSVTALAVVVVVLGAGGGVLVWVAVLESLVVVRLPRLSAKAFFEGSDQTAPFGLSSSWADAFAELCED